MKPHLWGIILVLALTIAVIPATHAQPGCAIATESGMIPDSDCDGVPDALDNCPAVANSDQRDMNRNGVGDACDLLISEIIVNPDNHLRQGDFAHITIRVLNNRDGALQDITINARNKELGIDAIGNIPYVPVGETGQTDFWLKIPKCATTQSYPLSITASFKEPANGAAANEVQTETIYVDKGACGTPNGSLDNTVITVFNKLDVDEGGSVLLPVSIANLGDGQATYDLSLQDMGNLGTWRIDPASRMKLASGVRSNANLYLQIERGVGAGTRTLQLTVTSDNQKTTIPIELYVRSPVKTAVPFAFIAFQFIFVIVLVLLIIAAIIIAIRHNKRKNGSGTDRGNHKVEPYYDTAVSAKTAKKVETKTDEKEILTTKSGKTKTRKTVAVENAGKDRMETYY